MLEVAARVVLGAVLVGSSAAKLASSGTSRAALSTFGFTGPRTQGVVWAALIATELLLAVGVVAGSDVAALLAAGLVALFAAAVAGAMLRGHAGAPCACFGARSTVSGAAIARNLLLAAGFAALPLLPAGELSTDEWLGLGLAVSLIACGALIVAVLALGREVGMLRLRLGPAGALEVSSEGPTLGGRIDLVERFAAGPHVELALAVFTSRGCRVCDSLEPALASLARDPLLALQRFDEHEEAETWETLRIPGSPFALALDLDGRVLAKGTFNNLAQLESVLAAAERRRAEHGFVEALGG